MGGKYTVDKNKISFTEMFTTEMYCEGSLDSDFSKMLGEVQSYLFTSKGELILELKLDTGSMIFR
jgi:heat shock protein HslJ